MNKYCPTAIAFLLAIPHFCFAQKCFEKGVNILQPGIGLGIYKTEFTDKTFSGAVIDKDTAGATLFQADFERGVTNWLGVGGKINYSKYINGNDSVQSNESARGIDIAVVVRAHALRTKRIDLYAGLDFGYSHFAYDANNYSGGIARAGGSYVSINLNSRFFIGKSWGLRLFYNFDAYNYPNGEITDSFSNSYKFALKSRSFFLLGAGLTFKIS